MKALRRFHLYAGCIFAPVLILFASTGVPQLFGIRLGVLTEIHAKAYGSLAFAILSALMGVSVVMTTFAGVAMAWQMKAERKPVLACLAFGTFVPVALLLVAHYRT